MTTGPKSPSRDSAERALDAALSNALRQPLLPAEFRSRLTAQIACLGESARIQTLGARIEREHRKRLEELDAGYVRMHRNTVALMIGGTFAAGASVVVLLPVLADVFGSSAAFVLTLLGALAGLAAAMTTWTRVSG
jgi:hypothetical protein